jgi:patatin-like phospholipase/acyl hydrolase
MTRPPQKRLLALDGGGLMGLISLGILQRMEDQLRAAHGGHDDFRLRDYFDYIAGTSTGAIIAAGLMTGMRVSELRDLYVDLGPQMFTRVAWWKLVPLALTSRQYHHEPIGEMLRQKLGAGTILEMQESGALPTDKHLMVVMHNLNTDSPWCISTNPEARYNKLDHPQCNRRLALWQLVRASTAAPGYFFPEQVQLNPEDPTSIRTFQDGGLTPHNNPALKLFQMATLPQSGLGWETGVDRMMLVSVGTGRQEKLIKKPKAQGVGIRKLAAAAPSWLMAGASAENDLMCRMLGHRVHGHKIDNEVGDLKTGSIDGKLFTYARYDISLTDDLLKELKLAGHAKDLKLDSVLRIKDLEVIGNKASEQVEFGRHFESFMP